ncbi:MAG: hypothetical protein ACR2L2_20495 [Acidobacteriota bacterium]
MRTFFLLLLLAQATGQFPTLSELEQGIPSAPELRAARVELERMRIERNLWNRVTVHANYSQHFSSFVPFVPTPGLAVSGGTFAGLSIALPIGELFGRPTVRDLDQQLKILEYERLYRDRLTSLRVLYVERQKRIDHLRVLTAQAKTAALELEKVRIGLSFKQSGPFSVVFDPIDLARAEQKAAEIEGERSATELEIRNLETRMLAMVGQRKAAP